MRFMKTVPQHFILFRQCTGKCVWFS